jgi:hypothetical protein
MNNFMLNLNEDDDVSLKTSKLAAQCINDDDDSFESESSDCKDSPRNKEYLEGYCKIFNEETNLKIDSDVKNLKIDLEENQTKVCMKCKNTVDWESSECNFCYIGFLGRKRKNWSAYNRCVSCPDYLELNSIDDNLCNDCYNKTFEICPCGLESEFDKLCKDCYETEKYIKGKIKELKEKMYSEEETKFRDSFINNINNEPVDNKCIICSEEKKNENKTCKKCTLKIKIRSLITPVIVKHEKIGVVDFCEGCGVTRDENYRFCNVCDKYNSDRIKIFNILNS